MNRYISNLAIFIPLFAFSCIGYRFSTDISERDLHHHIQRLASEEFQGRLPGTPGDSLTGNYIKKQFDRLGIAYRKQDFSFIKSVRAGTENSVAINYHAVSGDEFIPPVSSDTVFAASLYLPGMA
jgi:hypothetical protein